ncbi:MAG TPA: hypothetical protein VFA23_09410 [Dongiaceae bacterium]|nr:hypothetical protein [Dongiaceae bacterium]
MNARPWVVAASFLILSHVRQAGAAMDPNWPCQQVLQPELSIGAMWTGPDPTAAERSWEKDQPVRELVDRIAPRRVPLAEAEDEIRRFAAGLAADRTKRLTEVFAGLFDRINEERGAIIRGIRRYHSRQAALAKTIETKTGELDKLDPASADQAVQQKRDGLEMELSWDQRVFDDRQRLLPAVCEQPVVLEQRLFQLSRTVMEALGQ